MEAAVGMTASKNERSGKGKELNMSKMDGIP